MQLNKHKVATLNYTLKDEDGNIIDESKDGSFSYLHGANNIIPGLEKALEGKQAGDQINVVIEPKDAYGERNLEKIERVPKDMFPPDSEIKEGMQFEGQSAQGEPIIITVTAKVIIPRAICCMNENGFTFTMRHFELGLHQVLYIYIYSV